MSENSSFANIVDQSLDNPAQDIANAIGNAPPDPTLTPAVTQDPAIDILTQPVGQPVAPVAPVQQPVAPVQEQVVQQPLVQQPLVQQPIATPVAEPLPPGPEFTQPIQPAAIPGQPVPAAVPGGQLPPVQQAPPQQVAQPIATAPPIQGNPMAAQPTGISPGQPNPAMQIDPAAAFAPPLQPGQQLICKINPGKFDAFVKILSILNDKNVIVINNSQICQSINNGSAIVTANLASLLDSTGHISLHILNPKKYLKYFKNIKGEADIHFIDDVNNQRYIVTNGDMSIYLPKQIEALEAEPAPVDITTAEPIGQTVEIDKDVRNTITTMASDSANVDLLIHNNQLKGVYVPETAVYSFKEYIKDQIDDINADLKLRSYSFLTVPGDTYKVSLGKIGDTLWLLTFVNTGLVTISVLENLQPVSDENLII